MDFIEEVLKESIFGYQKCNACMNNKAKFIVSHIVQK
jgi:hypothetical protein